jgi:hypothetical protein
MFWWMAKLYKPKSDCPKLEVGRQKREDIFDELWHNVVTKDCIASG